jgi:hypothetical protein
VQIHNFLWMKTQREKASLQAKLTVPAAPGDCEFPVNVDLPIG